MEDRWSETNSRTFLDRGRVFTPDRDGIARVIGDLIPAAPADAFVAVDIGCGQGWLSAAVLGRFPAARVLALDGSPAMLAAARELLAPFGGRADFRQFDLFDPAWPDRIGGPVRCLLSSLALHHLDGPAKRALYARLLPVLEPGGALLMADLIEPTSEPQRRHYARAWDEIVREQSLAFTGDLRAYEAFLAERWNLFDHPDPDVDKPSTLPDHLRWLAEAGYVGVDAFWLRAGHAIFGGYCAPA
jgi:trans-aconitate methyltransferase